MIAIAAAVVLTVSTLLFSPSNQLSQSDLYKAYNDDFKTMGFYYEETSDQDSNGIVGIPADLLSYLN